MEHRNHNTLAWHETLELHEIVAYNSIGLMKLKKCLPKIQDHHLITIYRQTILELETALQELLQFYQLAPHPGSSAEYRQLGDNFFAGDLLAFTKSAVRNYAVAITETATHELRKVFFKQLNTAIIAHERIYQFMYQNSLYPSYDLDKLLQNDVMLARTALSL